MNFQPQPGDPIGVIAAQSIGQPATQLSLSSFKEAGVGTTSVKQGISKFEGIIHVSKAMQHFSCYVYFNKSIDYRELRKHFIYTTIADIYDDIMIEEHPSELEWWYAVWREHHYLDFDYERVRGSTRIRIVFDKARLYFLRLYLSEIAHVIVDAIANVFVVPSPDYLCTLDLYFKITYLSAHEMKAAIIDVVRNKLLDLRVAGMEGISRIAPLQHDAIVTEGSNLAAILASTTLDVDRRRTYSDCVWDVYVTLGIEAARYTVFREVRKALGDVDFARNNKHVSLLADVMTNIGKPVSTTKAGAKKQEMGFLSKMSYEGMMTELQKIAAGEEDHLLGVSERIITGMRMLMGTGSFEVKTEKQEE
jgi:DNA-directed RNA polymerase II subunit RPB1